MTTAVQFGQAKDPDDVGVWYAISWPTAVVQQVVGVTTGLPVAADLSLGGGSFVTPGDADPGADLTVANAQLWASAGGVPGTAAQVPADSVAFQLSGGVPGNTYPVRAEVILTDGSTVFRSAILTVTGR